MTTQGESLVEHFQSEGYPVIGVSFAKNRYVRLADILLTLVQRRKEIDIQCLQVFGGPSFVVEDLASSVGRLLGQKIIMVLRGGAFPEFMKRYPSWCRRVLSRADAIVSPSTFLSKFVETQGFPCEVIPNIIKLSSYPFRLRQKLSPRLLWMRTFHPIYNPEMAVRVMANVHKEIPGATLVIAGQDKGQQSKVHQLSQQLGLQDAVTFPGYLSMSSKFQEGNVAEIFLNTNHVDNMPVSVVEACAMGLPVVATKVGGIPDLLTDGETGLLVPDDDDVAMTSAVFRLLKDPSLAETLSRNGRKLAERSSWEQIKPKWEDVFSRMMS